MARVRGKCFGTSPLPPRKNASAAPRSIQKEYYEEGCKKVTDSMRTPVRNTEKREWGEWKSGKNAIRVVVVTV